MTLAASHSNRFRISLNQTSPRPALFGVQAEGDQESPLRLNVLLLHEEAVERAFAEASLFDGTARAQVRGKPEDLSLIEDELAAGSREPLTYSPICVAAATRPAGASTHSRRDRELLRLLARPFRSEDSKWIEEALASGKMATRSATARSHLRDYSRRRVAGARAMTGRSGKRFRDDHQGVAFRPFLDPQSAADDDQGTGLSTTREPSSIQSAGRTAQPRPRFPCYRVTAIALDARGFFVRQRRQADPKADPLGLGTWPALELKVDRTGGSPSPYHRPTAPSRRWNLAGGAFPGGRWGGTRRAIDP